jgi:hypothetical protein
MVCRCLAPSLCTWSMERNGTPGGLARRWVSARRQTGHRARRQVDDRGRLQADAPHRPMEATHRRGIAEFRCSREAQFQERRSRARAGRYPGLGEARRPSTERFGSRCNVEYSRMHSSCTHATAWVLRPLFFHSQHLRNPITRDSENDAIFLNIREVIRYEHQARP